MKHASCCWQRFCWLPGCSSVDRTDAEPHLNKILIRQLCSSARGMQQRSSWCHCCCCYCTAAVAGGHPLPDHPFAPDPVRGDLFVLLGSKVRIKEIDHNESHAHELRCVLCCELWREHREPSSSWLQHHSHSCSCQQTESIAHVCCLSVHTGVVCTASALLTCTCSRALHLFLAYVALAGILL